MSNDCPHLPGLYRATCPFRVYRADCVDVVRQVQKVGAAMSIIDLLATTTDRYCNCPPSGHVRSNTAPVAFPAWQYRSKFHRDADGQAAWMDALTTGSRKSLSLYGYEIREQ